MTPTKGLIALTCLCFLSLAPSAMIARDARSIQPLLRPTDAANQQIRGEIELRRGSDRERFKVSVHGADALLDHDLYIENDAMEMEWVAELKRGASELRFEARTDKDDGLPLDVASVSDLIGRQVEIRSGAEILLFGAVGDVTVLSKAKAKQNLASASAPDGARAQLRIRSNPRKGDERFEVKVDHLTLADDQALHLFIEDPDALGTLVDVGSLQAHGKGKVELRARTSKGQSLPFGVGSVRDLADLAIEIKDAASLEAYFEGTIPAL